MGAVYIVVVKYVMKIDCFIEVKLGIVTNK